MGIQIAVIFPRFTINGCKLNFANFVSQFKYLGHIISDTTNDDDDLRRETRNLSVRTNASIV